MLWNFTTQAKPAKLQGAPAPILPLLGLQAHITVPSFSCVSWRFEHRSLYLGRELFTVALLWSKNILERSGSSESPLLLTFLLHPQRGVDNFPRNLLRIGSLGPSGDIMNSHHPVLSTFSVKNCGRIPYPQGATSASVTERWENGDGASKSAMSTLHSAPDIRASNTGRRTRRQKMPAFLSEPNTV